MDCRAEDSVDGLAEEIRTLINNPRKSSALQKDSGVWTLLCSCLDTIGDTDLVIDAYFSSSPSPGFGEAYLLVYGVLQALFVQQGAVMHLCEALEIPYAPEPVLKTIREIRNNSVGHPCKRDRVKPVTYSFLSRATLTKTEFQLITMSGEADTKYEQIHIPTVISLQYKAIGVVLRKIVGELKTEEEECRNRYRGDKLLVVSRKTLRFCFKEIHLAIYGSRPLDVGKKRLDQVVQEIQVFRDRLKVGERESFYDYVIRAIELLDRPISRLMDFFDEDLSSDLTAADAADSASYIEKEIVELNDNVTSSQVPPHRLGNYVPGHRLLMPGYTCCAG